MKKAAGTALLLVMMTASNARAIPPETMDLGAAASSSSSGIIKTAQPVPYTHVPVFEGKEKPKNLALQQYQKRPSSELSKLIYLGDLLKQSGFKIVHAGQTYDPKAIAPMVTLYVRLNYKKETAEAWIAKHAYRNGPSYKVIYVKDTQGKLILLRDFLLEELETL